MRTSRLAVALTLGLLASSAAASAQTLPPPTTRAAVRVPDARLPLTMAYRAIGLAEAFGASGHYLDAAREHYRGALARYGHGDQPGAGAEARLAGDLARVALAERPLPTPHDLPAPPAPAADMSAPKTMTGVAAMGPGGGCGPCAMRRGMRGRGRGAVGIAEVGRLLKIENTPEAHALADAAFAADQAAVKAAYGGDLPTARRQKRIADALGSAVRDLAMLDHPELRQRPHFPGMRRPMGPGAGPGGAHAAFAPDLDDEDGGDDSAG